MTESELDPLCSIAPLSSQPFSAPLSSKCLIAYLYFIQGVFLALPGTIILTYAQVPSYDVLTLFSMAPLPWSFKFITAPLIEKFTSTKYGRRKTWIVITLVISSGLMCALAKIASEESMQVYTAMLLTFTIFFVSLEDISTDALANKQIKDASLISLLQSVMQQIGVVTGSILFLKLINPSFGQFFGLDGQIFTIQGFLQFSALFSLLPALIIHFTFKETTTDKELLAEGDTLVQILRHYKHFVNPKYTTARQCIMFLFFCHGLLYFIAGYEIELIKRDFSKQLLSEVKNACMIPAILTSFIVSKQIDKNNAHSAYRYTAGAMFICYFCFFQLNSTDPYISSATLVVISVLSNCKFFLSSVIVNMYADSRYSALCITMMASLINLGNSTTLQLQFISHLGYENACYFGFTIIACTLIFSKQIIVWVKGGEPQETKGE